MNESEILTKVQRKEHEKRCIDAGVCPDCGGNIKKKYWGEFNPFYDKTCKACGKNWG